MNETQQPPHITADEIQVLSSDELWKLECSPHAGDSTFVCIQCDERNTDIMKGEELKQKIIQGLEYTDNPNVPIGLKLIDEVRTLYEKRIKLFNDMKNDPQTKNWDLVVDVQKECIILKSLLDKAGVIS